MTTFTLYASPGACSLASHIVLREAGAQFSLTQVDLGRHQTEDGRDFYAINPKGYVPALQFDDGSVLTEGPAIMQFIADAYPTSDLAPKAGTLARARVQEDLTFIGTEVHKTFSPLFEPDAPQSVHEASRAKLKKRFGLIEQRLLDGRMWLGGEQFSVADAYLYVVTNWSIAKDVDMSPWPALLDWRGRVAARPHVQAALAVEGLA